MNKPVLVVMAAGLGSRYGGLKQIDPVGDNGEPILGFSLYDAKRAGFETVVFLIKKEIEADFRSAVGDRAAKLMEVRYAFQTLDALPKGFSVPEGRRKPWGTAHAVLCCKDVIDGPFAVINADDYYGRNAFSLIYEFLTQRQPLSGRHYAMVGYILENTLTENGHVARGICTVTPEGYLSDLCERTRIEKRNGRTEYTEDGGLRWTEIPAGSTVSMNMWGFSPEILDEIETRFPDFLRQEAAHDPLKAEFFLPSVVDAQIRSGEADVKVLRTPDKWYGVTYREDRATVVEAIRSMRRQGIYPAKLWD